jgi:protein-tyrosine phosphatase
VVDLHTHVLPGVDDGPATLAEAVDLVAGAAAAGVVTIVATPHVSARYPNTPTVVAGGVSALAAALAERSVAVRVLPGAEVESALLPSLAAADVEALTIGGTGRYLLVELPWDRVDAETGYLVRQLVSRGIRPVIAHPERYAYVQETPAVLASLTEAGAVLQVTVSSLLGDHGRAAAATARLLLDRGLAHLLASDMHGAGLKRAPLADAAGAVSDRMLLDWLTRDVPGAIARGDDLPERPRTGRRLLRRR